MKRIVAMLVLLLIVAVTPAAADDDFFSYDLVFPNVELRPGVTADINVLVLQNSDRKCHNGHKGYRGKSITALHGLANTASTWKLLAKELFSDNPIGPEVCRILAINLPGRGYSSLPKGEANLSFGQLTLDDHVQAVIGTLERIRQAGFHPETIMAHSQGGLIVQMVQQALLTDGSSLRAEFEIKKAFLIAPIAPVGVSWYFADPTVSEPVLSPYLTYNLVLGAHVAIPSIPAIPPDEDDKDDWQLLFFTYPYPHGLTTNAPPLETVVTEGYNSPEPLYASLQLLRLEGAGIATVFELKDPGAPQAVDPGIFDRTGTRLEFVAMSQDSFQAFPEQVELGEQEAVLYEYLTNDTKRKRFAVVVPEDADTVDAVHSMYISNPRGLLEALVPSNISLP